MDREEKWNYLCWQLGILEDQGKQDLIRGFVKYSNENVLQLTVKVFKEELGKRLVEENII